MLYRRLQEVNNRKAKRASNLSPAIIVADTPLALAGSAGGTMRTNQVTFKGNKLKKPDKIDDHDKGDDTDDDDDDDGKNDESQFRSVTHLDGSYIFPSGRSMSKTCELLGKQQTYLEDSLNRHQALSEAIIFRRRLRSNGMHTSSGSVSSNSSNSSSSSSDNNMNSSSSSSSSSSSISSSSSSSSSNNSLTVYDTELLYVSLQ